MKSAYLRYFAALLLFGSNGIVAGRLHMNSCEIVFWRTLIGSLLLAALFFLSHGKIRFWRYKKQSLFLCLSGMAMGASWMFLYEAYAQVGVSVASLCYYCGPVIVMALSPALFRERLTAANAVGFAAVLCGVFLVNGGTPGGGGVRGSFCGFMSAVMYAAMVICNKKAAPIGGLENATLQLCVSFLTVAAFVLFRQGFALSVPRGDVIPLLALGLINTGAGCYLYFSSIGRLPVQTVSLCGYLEPLSAVVFSMLFLHETMSPVQIAGAVLIIAGAVAGEAVRFKKKIPSGT